MFASILFSVATGLALFRLRKTVPDHPRPYRTLGYPLVPVIFILGVFAFVINTLRERPAESLAGLGLLALGHAGLLVLESHTMTAEAAAPRA